MTYQEIFEEKKRARYQRYKVKKDVFRKTEAGKAARKIESRKKHLKKYGMTPSDFERMVTVQNGCCAICFHDLDKEKKCIDHNHKTGNIRGILCSPCNIALGFLREKVENAQSMIRYIRRHSDGTSAVSSIRK